MSSASSPGQRRQRSPAPFRCRARRFDHTFVAVTRFALYSGNISRRHDAMPESSATIMCVAPAVAAHSRIVFSTERRTFAISSLVGSASGLSIAIA
jgi:hypothetical protein